MNDRLVMFWNRHRQFLVYSLIGGTGVTLDFLAFYCLTAGAGLHYQVANGLSVSLGITNNFWWNVRFNFPVRDRLGRRFLAFCAVGLLGLALSAALLWLLVAGAKLDEIPAKLATLVVVLLVQYNLNRRTAFGAARTGTQPE